MRVVIRIRRRSTRASRFVTGSLVVHAVLAALLLALPGFARKPPVLEDALIVELAGGLPAPPAGATAPAPAPPQAPPEGPSAVPEVPPPAKKPEKKQEKPPEKPKPIPSSEPPAQTTGGPTGSAAPAGPEAFPEATGSGIMAVGSGDPTLAGYYARISALLNGQWIRPVLLDDGGDAREVVVSFDIARNGNVFNLKVDSGSGLDVLDRSALRAVLDASPLPPPPGGWRGASVPVRVRFVLDPRTS